MTPFDTYQAFVALKRHFTPGSTYDYHKYRGKTNIRPRHFELRADRYHFEKLSRLRDPKTYLVANLSENPKMWVGELFTDEAQDRFLEWCRVTESITYALSQQLDKLHEDFDDNLTFHDGEHPPVLVAMGMGDLHPAVVSLLDQLCNFTPSWTKYAWDPIVSQGIHKIRSLRGFFEFDADRCKRAIIKVFADSNKEASILHK